MRKLVKASTNAKRAKSKISAASGVPSLGKFAKYYNSVTKQEVVKGYGCSDDDIRDVGTTFEGYDLEVAGYAMAKDEYMDALADSAIDFAYITTDGELVYDVKERVYTLSISEVTNALR